MGENLMLRRQSRAGQYLAWGAIENHPRQMSQFVPYFIWRSRESQNGRLP